MVFRRGLMQVALLKVTILLVLTHTQVASAFSWRSDPKVRSARGQFAGLAPSSSASQLLQAGSRIPNSYEVALSELQQLESEPLCHRIAARLLVNNCQLLEGKDEATVLTDSGRKIRDFVDSYAASLAICDLERGSFVIPRECSKFRESALGQLPLQNTAQLHVTSREIDGCLAGLGASDSAWNTWVSYRHKALRFCEAARADNDRAQNILLFQRLTHIMSRLADDVDDKFDRRMNDLDFRAQATGDKIDSLFPHLDRLQEGLLSAENVLSRQLMTALKTSTDSVNAGIDNAANLQKMLELTLRGIVDSHAEAASVHEHSLQTMNQQAESGLETMMKAMGAALATSITLHNQIESSRLQAAQLESRQDAIELGMLRLIDITESLSTRYDDHTHLLQHAQNMTNEILDSLEDTVASAAMSWSEMLSAYGFLQCAPRKALLALRSLACYGLLLGFVALYYLLFFSSYGPSALQYSYHRSRPVFDSYNELLNDVSSTRHAIDDLILDAKRAQDRLLLERSHDVGTAAAGYRSRRGRHPPPGFDKWFEYASKHDATITERFFDRIEHDIRPFWAQDPRIISKHAANGEHVVRVRDGAAYGIGDTKGHVPWLQLWTGLVSEAAAWLPDVDMPINYWDESRILAPWDEINSLVTEAERNKKITPTKDTVREFTKRAHLGGDENVEIREPDWITTGASKLWDLARQTCPPDTPGCNVSAIEDFSAPPSFPTDWHPPFSENGGAFVQWARIEVTQELVPMFGGSKLTMNNDILIPGAMYLSGELRYSGGWNHGPPWEQKKEGVVWRGVGSGGRLQADNWSHFQRFRLVQMLNGTTVSELEQGNRSAAPTFGNMPDGMRSFSCPGLSLGEWLQAHSDTGFTYMQCFPENDCGYLEPYFSKVDAVSMADQFKWKFMPDVDGNSFSARFRSLLLSTSLPLKSTIFAEWHDDRLAPWVHFVPLDNMLMDLYGVLDYFLKDEKGHAAARMIAETGRRWAEKVLRREDMLLYVWRLLLEFARVCDERRHSLGFVDDLL
ncbi:Uu.00g129440.m01.CDS01 [Anthostomella pinea]|uniref:Uu.00g129440.m01.CDS01 n=1 Tax=Anthostomella pinea TaxID=933095 RepID=A0AAI8YHZ4_9PEZI|nr:Uu.00g129440.m01.CDS01 [Anthostomella pinea]